ncbi:MAG: class I SAM-dependent methyltransferase [Desulfovibrio sp.]|nr:MAG: class I SAM-dependent methyltransferase [Desulfovibrio sp.]
MSDDMFGEAATTWDDNPERVRMAEEFSREVEKLFAFTPETVAMDFGCGTGLIGLRLAPRVKKLYMVDSSQAMLAVLRSKLDSENIANVVVSSAPLGKAVEKTSLDLVFSSMALHHVDDLPKLFTDMHAVMKPGAALIIGELLAEDGSFHGDKAVPHHGFVPEELAALMEERGFEVLHHHAHGMVNKPGPDGGLRQFGKFVLKACTR